MAGPARFVRSEYLQQAAGPGKSRLTLAGGFFLLLKNR
jgi:hypothetical protein